MSLAKVVGVVALVALSIPALPAAELDVSRLQEGQQVEVREGDIWGLATYLKREGRRFQIRYDDGTEDWITSDRLRAVGASSASPPTTMASTTAPTQAARKNTFAVGDIVEYRARANWEVGRIDKITRGWYLVQQTGFPNYSFWVEPWRLRMPGSLYDLQGRPNWLTPARAAAPVPDGGPGAALANNGQSRFVGKAVTGNDELASTDEPMRHSAAPLKLTAAAPVTGTRPFKTSPIAVENRDYRITPCSDAAGIAVFSAERYKQPTELQVLNLTGNSVQSPAVTLPDNAGTVLAATDQGRLIATTEMHSGRLTLWARQGNSYKPTGVVIPFGGGLTGSIARAVFTSPKRMVVVASHGEAVAVDLDAGKIVGRVKGPPGATVALHPTGKLLAVTDSSSRGIQIIQTDTWTVQAAIRGGFGVFPRPMSFDPSGSYLAASSYSGGGLVVIYDTATGAQVSSIPAPAGMPGTMQLLDDKTALYDNSYVVDLKTSAALWAWTGQSKVGTSILPSGQVVLAAISGNQANIHVVTPLSEAVQSLQKDLQSKTLPQAIRGKLALMPGMKVGLRCDLSSMRGSPADAEAALRKKIEQAGFIVADNQPIFFSVSIREAGSARATLSSEGVNDINNGRAANAAVVVHKRVLAVSVVCEGNVIWTTEMKRDETSAVVSAEGRGDTRMGTSGGFSDFDIRNLNLPRYVVMPGGEDGAAPALGLTQISDDKTAVIRDPMGADATTIRPVKPLKPIAPEGGPRPPRGRKMDT